ncbi:hypothetical protein D3C78_1657600 [compost metagenome]
MGSGGRMKLLEPMKSPSMVSGLLAPRAVIRSATDTPPIRCSASLRGSRLSIQPRTSSCRPRPT